MGSPSSWRRFFAELKRRHVYRVAAVYAATGFVLIQVADLTFERLGLPSWSPTLVIVLVLAGFPIAVVLAWAFEVTPEGVRRSLPAQGRAGAPRPADDVEAPEAVAGPARTGTVFALAAGVALVAAGGWWLHESAGEPGRDVRRLAVLPLANLMEDPEQAYFVQGMHDRLISELQQAGVPVINRTSVMQYADGETPAVRIARALEVDALLEGSVYRIADSVEIEVRLIDPATGEYVWSASYGESLRNVAALHREVTRAIAGEIEAALGPEAEARLDEPSPVDPDAYDAFLKGVFHAQRFTPEDLSTALEYFETALEADPDYAPAWTGIARVWQFRAQASRTTGVTAEEARAHWEPALERALALDSTVADARMLRAGTETWSNWNFEEGLEAFERAIETNPSHAEVRVFHGHLLAILGRWEEARQEAERAVELDPLNPFIQALHGVVLQLTRRHEEAVRVLEEMFRRNPGAGFGRYPLLVAYEETGRWEDALRIRKEMARARGEPRVVAILERGFPEGPDRAGYREVLRRVVDTIAARRPGGEAPEPCRADLYARAGRPELALDCLENNIEARDQNAPYVGVSPVWEPFHGHPRFRELARRVGVPLVTASGAGST